MDIQNLTSVPVVVINSLLTLLKANHIDINSVVMQLSSDKDEDINLGELTQQTLNELQKAKAQKVAVPNKIEIEVKAHNLDCQIDELKSRIIEKNFMSNESEDQLEDLIAKAMVLGELYAKRDGVAVVVPDGFVLVPKTNSDKGIESMAMRYRHDFPLLDADYQEGIKSQMRQLYEEAVGLGFYSHKAQEQVG